ncbi:MAG: LysR family transcriptional regulator [Myxococcaceae bacterium]
MFLAVRANRSVTGAARALGATPSFVSKAVSRLERQLATRLVARSGRGVTLTHAGERLAPLLEDATDKLRRARRGVGVEREVTLVAPSFLLAAALPAFAQGLDSLRFRGLQLAGHAIQAQASLRQFEVALLVGEAKLPTAWQVTEVGDLTWGLYTNPKLAQKLGKPSLATLLTVPFVTPVSFNQGQWAPVDDGCPLKVGQRTAGHECETIAIGLEIAAITPQVIYGPKIAAQRTLSQKRLVEVPVAAWSVKRPMLLAVDVDQVTTPQLSQMKKVAESLVV